MKLLGISLGTLIIVAMVWTTLWLWGQGLQYQPYDHPLMSWSKTNDEPVMALAAEDLEEAQNFLKKNPAGVLSLKLHISGDGQLFTAKDSDLDFVRDLSKGDPAEYKGNKHFYYDFAFLKSKAPSLILLDSWAQLKPRFWIFDVQDNATNIDRTLAEWIQKNKLETQVVTTSPVDLVLTALKKEHPIWVYGSSMSDLNKMLTLASVQLESIANFKRDYYFTPIQIMNRDVLNARVFAEIKKRFKKVAIGPVHTDQDREKALLYNPDVLILDASLVK